MNKKLGLVLCSILVASCVGRRSGNITFLWTFAGGTCSTTASVTQVQVTIPGQTLQNNGVYPCDTSGTDGILLADFAPDTYDFTVDGLDNQGNILYSVSGTVTVDGDTTVTADLSPVAGPNSYALLSWTFPANSVSASPSCAQANVANVNVSIDGAAATAVACTSGEGGNTVQTALLDPGTHSLSLSAVDAAGNEYYHATGSFTTVAGQPASQGYTFQWSVGGLLVGWNIDNRTAQQVTCAGQGLTTVNVQLYQGSTPFSSPVPVDCTAGATELYVTPGTYGVVVYGTDASGNNYTTPTLNPVTVSVQLGSIPASNCTPGTDPGCVGLLTVTEQ